MRVERLAAVLALLLGMGVAGAGVASCERREPQCVGDTSAPPAEFDAALAIVGEDGRPIPRARVDLGDRVIKADEGGAVRLTGLSGPVLAVVSADGHFPEPVPVGRPRNLAPTLVRLVGDAGGKRVVVHSVGDVMFGRRYERPSEGTPLIPEDRAGKGARDVVGGVKRLLRAADFETANLETVLTNRSSAYPGKRFILRSRPATTEGLDELGINVVGLANNHARDFLDEGIADTLDALRAAGIPHVGATVDDTLPPPFITTVRGTRIGVLAYTTVEGSTVNDQYPAPDEPASGDPKRAWQYEARWWAFLGSSFVVPPAHRRIRSAWELFRDAEDAMPPAERAQAWSSAAHVYPELQDWVARRGHGGATAWRGAESIAQIRELAAQVDVTIVQLHAGFQFQPVASSGVQRIARQAVDAGAQLVVGHHPHVLQGLEWYRGALIAHSLGNFVFDQDFLSTFASVVLRTIWEGKRLVEARLVPVELDAYRPMPVTGHSARRTLRTIWERSAMGALAANTPSGLLTVVDDASAVSPTPARLVFEHDTARVVDTTAAPTIVHLELPPRTTVEVPTEGLVRGSLGVPGVLVGRDVFGWGHFERDAAGPHSTEGMHWQIAGCDKAIVRGEAAAGTAMLRMRRDALSERPMTAHPVARTPLVRHRLFAKTGPAGATMLALDPEPRYTIRLAARAEGSARAAVRLEFFQFDDTDATEDPESEPLGGVDLPLPLVSGGGFRVLEIPLPPDAVPPDANMVWVTVRLEPDASRLDLDDIAVLEWRAADAMHDRFGAYDFIRNDTDEVVRVDVQTLAPDGR